MLLVVLYGVGIYLTTWFNEFITTGPHGVVLAMFPLIWIGVVCVIGAFSAWFHRCWLLVPLAPVSYTHLQSGCAWFRLGIYGPERGSSGDYSEDRRWWRFHYLYGDDPAEEYWRVCGGHSFAVDAL